MEPGGLEAAWIGARIDNGDTKPRYVMKGVEENRTLLDDSNMEDCVAINGIIRKHLAFLCEFMN